MNYKQVALLFTTASIAISTFAILLPSYDLSLLFNLSKTYAIARVLLAFGILAYILIPKLRIKFTQIGMFAVGALLLSLGITSMYSPMLFGHLSTYTALGDVVLAIEAGILSLLASLQMQTSQLRFSKRYFTTAYYLNKLPDVKPGKLASPHTRAA